MRRTIITLSTALLTLLTIALPPATQAQALKIYWADEFAGRVYKSDPDGSNLITLISGDLLNCEEIVLGGGKIYWSDPERGLIQRADTDGANLETVVQSGEPGAVGLDLGNGKLYWVDRASDKIRRSNLDGTAVEMVRALAHTGTALTIAESSQYLYWSEYDSNLSQAVTYKWPLNSGPSVQIAVHQGVAQVRGLAVNEVDGWVYFGLGNQLRRMDTAGANQDALYAGGVNITAVACDQTGGKLYWADDGNWDITRSDLNGGTVEIVEGTARLADGVAVDPANAKVFWTEERFVVRADLNGSNQTHIVARPSYAAVGYYDALNRVYYSDLQRLETWYANNDGTGQTLFYQGASPANGGALAIQVDHGADKIYWLDGGDRWLRQADPDGGNAQDIMYLSGDAYDFALDLEGARVYWCGRTTGSIYRHNLDGSGSTETLYTGLNYPKGITLDLNRDRIIWGESDQIAHGPINGGGPVTVVFTDPFDVIGIVWDEADTRLYWADQLNSRVRRAHFNVGAGGWQSPETIFSMGLEHWPSRLALQHSFASGVEDVVALNAARHFAAPNPLNPSTTIHFSLALAGRVTLKIYDTHGRLVRELLRDTWTTPGAQQVRWDGRDATGRAVASGMYMYKIESGQSPMVGKMVLLK